MSILARLRTDWPALLAGLAALGIITAIACILSGCASTRITNVTAQPITVSTVNEWGEVWRYSVSPDGHEQWQYVGLLADRIDLDPANLDRIRL